MAPLLRQSGSASAYLFRLIFVALTASSEPPPSAGYQSGSARVGRPCPEPGVTAGSRRMFQALGGPDRYPAVPSASR